jgi:hypothetical protein
MDHALTLGWYVVPLVVTFFTAAICTLYFFFAYLIAKNEGTDYSKNAKFGMVALVVALFAPFWPIMLIGAVLTAVFLMVRDMFTKKEN